MKLFENHLVNFFRKNKLHNTHRILVLYNGEEFYLKIITKYLFAREFVMGNIFPFMKDFTTDEQFNNLKSKFEKLDLMIEIARRILNSMII